MTTDSGSTRNNTSGSIAALIGAEVLVLDNDARVHAGIEQLLAPAHMHVTCVSDEPSALALVDQKFFAVALIDIDTHVPRDGIATIRKLKQKSPTTMVIALTPRRSFDDAVDAVRAGAVDLILKAPDSVAYLKERVIDAVARSAGRREIDSVLAEIRKVHDEFLEKFMAAERVAIDTADKVAGRDQSRMIGMDEMTVLVVDEADTFVKAMTAAKPKGFGFQHAHSGGEALAILGGELHYAMISDELSDLPARTIAKSIRSASPDTVVLIYRGPGPEGQVNLIETAGTRPIVKPFTEASQLIARMDDLAEAWRAKARERRYTQLFREKHFDFLRRYVELKTKIDRALTDGVG
jgi:DNA-binding NtrC family response regulator